MSANDRFKSGWDRCVAWSTAAAAVLHLILFTWSPDLPGATARGISEFDRAMESVALQAGPVVAPSDGGPPSRLRGPRAPASVEAPASTVDDHADGPGLDAGPSSGAEALRDYLRRRTEPGPTIVDLAAGTSPGGGGTSLPGGQAMAEPTMVADATSSETGRRIDGSASTTGREEGGERDGVGAGRLSALQPELAYHAPSPWLLIQNPDEVEGFLQRNFPQANQVRGTVSVALWIDDRGSVEWAEINRSSGLPDVDESALRLFSRVVSYRPARKQGVRVPVAVIFSLTFPL